MPAFASPDIEAAWSAIETTLEELLSRLDGLDDGQLGWLPPVPESNSLFTLAWHSMGSVERQLYFLFAGQPGAGDREAEFRASGTRADIDRRWAELRPRLADTLARVPPSALDATFTHPRRGPLAGRRFLTNVLAHCAEHLGHAGLTRDLLLASS
jgi:hypothetical protein